MSLSMTKCGLPAPHLSSRPPSREPGSSIGWCKWTPDQVRGDSHWVQGDSHWVQVTKAIVEILFD